MGFLIPIPRGVATCWKVVRSDRADVEALRAEGVECSLHQ